MRLQVEWLGCELEEVSVLIVGYQCELKAGQMNQTKLELGKKDESWQHLKSLCVVLTTNKWTAGLFKEILSG